MSDDTPFDLEPNEPSERPAARPKEVPVLKRTPTRKRVARPPRTRSAAAGRAGRGKLTRWLGWLVAPRFYYGLGFVLTAGVIFALYNPTWGGLSRQWPHKVLGLSGGAWTWDAQTAQLITLVVLALALLAAMFLRPGRGRAVTVLFCAALVFVTLDSRTPLLLLGGFALTGGALLVPCGTPRAAALVVGLGLLAAHLFLPWAEGTFTRGIELAPRYQATAFDTIDGIAASDGQTAGPAARVLERIEPAVALLLAGVGLLTWIGIGGRWARWTTGVLLLVLVLGRLARLYGNGSEGADPAFEAGAAAAARQWFHWAGAYALVLVAAVADGLGAVDRSAP